MTDWIDQLPNDRLLAELSLWSADLGRLAEEIQRVDELADMYHIDVADGHFSPALLFFPDLVAACRRHTTKPFHVHLMATDDILEDQIRQFADVGANLITVHAENGDVDRALAQIADLGLASGIVLQLFTPVDAAAQYLDRISMLTLLGTEIGVKGRGLETEAEPRLREASALLETHSHQQRIVLSADGAIRDHTVPGLRKAGAQNIVMGSLAFKAEDFESRMAWVRSQEGPRGG